MDAIANNTGYTKSLWMDVRLPQFPSLKKNEEVDVCIVGAGIAGLTCAYTLAKNGKSVIVVDQGMVGGGQTARTTAHLSWALNDRYYNLEKLFGLEGAKIAAESHSEAIDHIEKIIREEKIDCDFERVNGYLFTARGDSTDNLDKEFASIQKIGMNIEKMNGNLFGSSSDIGTYLRYPKQAQFHVLKYLKGLIDAILKYNGKIFCDTHVNRFEDGSPCIVKTQSGAEISAGSVIVSTCSPVNDRFYIHTKQSSYRTYVIAASIPKESLSKGLYWDTADPYRYIRTQKHSDSNLNWLLMGGGDHRTGQESEIVARFDHLEEWIRMRLPTMGKIEYRWSGQVFDSVDSLAFIGKNPGDTNIYIATGDSGNGMTHGTIAGILLPDLILDRINPWKNLYEPSRKTISAAGEFIEGICNVAMQYRDWFTPGEIKKVDALIHGEGIVLREGLKKIAVYKDKQNNVHINSALCPHLAGCVRWNSCEKSWDCPCHGSRFDGYGKIMNGPAINDLSPFTKE